MPAPRYYRIKHAKERRNLLRAKVEAKKKSPDPFVLASPRPDLDPAEIKRLADKEEEKELRALFYGAGLVQMTIPENPTPPPPVTGQSVWDRIQRKKP